MEWRCNSCSFFDGNDKCLHPDHPWSGIKYWNLCADWKRLEAKENEDKL
jgi:hypothetical protein